MTLNWEQFVSRPRVSDGAWGTQLQRRGLRPGSAPELWNTQRSQDVLAVATAYVDAGSDLVLTNTFGGNRIALTGHVDPDEVAELVRTGAAISRQAAGDDAFVFGSIGPTGKIVMMGDVPAEDISAAFGEAATALAEGGADAIVCESFLELEEAMLAVDAAVATSLPVVVSMTFDSGPDGTSTMMGNRPADLAEAARQHGASAVGANCGAGPEKYIAVARLLREATDLPVWIKPNAGLPNVDSEGNTVFPMDADEFAGFVPTLLEAGASILGGCCGTGPEHIAAVRRAVDGA